uniref:RRM domain-containing protein n=1 Tax=Brassica campestris TaxID=3711 RepID=M4ER17_BRACM
MFYRGYGDGRDGREMGPKRQRMIEQAPPPGTFYGPHPGSAFMFNPYGFVPPPVFPVVRLRGLPFDCAELDVVEFFRGLDVVDVLFVHKNNKAEHGRRYVEVFRSTKQEYYKAIANEVAESRVHGTVTGGGGDGGRGGGSGGHSPRRNVQRVRSSDDGKENADHTGILRLRGLPFSAGKEDILDFFKDFDLSEDSIHVTVNGEGRPTGDAFVEFGSAEESRAAMVKDRKMLGSRYIELFPSSVEELEDALSRGR